MVTCSKFSGSANKVPGAVVAFEVLSRSSGRIDRIVKVREYAAVASIRRYVILESTGVGLTALHRETGEEPWIANTLTEPADMLHLPEIGIEIPVSEFYAGIDFENASDGG